MSVRVTLKGNETGLKMDGTAISSVEGHDRLGRLVPGHSEYAAKRRRIAARLAQLVADYEPSPSQQQLLAIVAQHLDGAERARSLIQRVRAGNAARRLLRDIPRKPEQPPPSLESYKRKREAQP
jgi:hypothetical protein